MTSVHFVVHPLPGTEDQLNDRYRNILFEQFNKWATIRELFLMWLVLQLALPFSL